MDMQGKGKGPLPLHPIPKTNNKTKTNTNNKIKVVYTEDWTHPGFAEILFDPNGTTCDFATHNLPYDFHLMYATASEHTRVPWAAHGFSVGFSDEIGHFEYCNAVDAQGGHCTQPSISDPAGPDVDDRGCFTADFASSFGLVPVGGCLGEDDDYDGLDYGLVWPGTLRKC